jgi:hypothetical protein
LYICSKPDQLIKPNDQGRYAISTDLAFIYACGKLNTKSPVRLHFYLYKDPNAKPVDNSPAGQEFAEGFFNQQLYLPGKDRQGHYRIDVYLFRDIIASSEFDVIDQ